MICVVYALTQHWPTIFWVLQCLFSTTIGVIAYASAVCESHFARLKNRFYCSGIHMDGITLVALLMEIGVTVDYSAHITCHYFDRRHRGR